MNALSLDLRQRIVQAVDGGLSQSEAARRFCISRKSVARLLRRRQESGSLKARVRPGATRRVPQAQHEAVAAQMRRHPQHSLEEHARLWEQEQGQRLSDTTLWRTLKRMGWSHKKRALRPASKTNRRAKSGKGKPVG